MHIDFSDLWIYNLTDNHMKVGARILKTGNICKFTEKVLSETLAVSCFVLECNPEVMIRPRCVNGYMAILITRGEGILRFDGHSVDVGSGTLIFALNGEEISAEMSDGGAYMYISFDGSRADELIRRFGISVTNRVFNGFEGLLPLWNESLARADADTVDLVSESILLYTFSRLSGASAQRSGIVDRMIEITEDNFKDPGLSLATVAQALSYNPKYLSHAFKESMGVGYAEYLRSIRIRFAVSLLDLGIDSIKNVALLSGFTDPLYFSTVFKKELGVSPKEYIASRK